MIVERRRNGMPAASKLGITLAWLFVSTLLLAAVASSRTTGSFSVEALGMLAPTLAILGIAMLLVARLAWCLIGEREAVMAPLTLALSIPLLVQTGSWLTDSSGLQMLCVLSALNGFLSRSSRTGGWITGLSLSVLISISMAALPIAISICAFAALKWLRSRLDRMWLVHISQALALGLIASFLASRGWGILSTHCAAVGPTHLAMACWAALVLSAMARAGPVPNGALIGGFSLAVGGAYGILVLGTPNCAGLSGLAELGTAKWSANNLGTGLPIKQPGTGAMLELIGLPLIGLWASLHLAARNANWLRQWWFDYAILLAAVLIIAILAPDYGVIAAVMAAPPLGWQVCKWLDGIGNMKSGLKRAIALLTLAIALLPSIAFEVIDRSLL